MRNNSETRNLTIVSFCIALNIIGAFIAMNLRLPIYVDSIGTIMAAIILGPKYAVMTGICGSLISGTFDMYSLYFAPVQISTGIFASYVFRKGVLKGKKLALGVLIFSIPTSLISAFICAFIFGGITSSGSSYIIQVISALGINKVSAAFITQFMTDYADKFIASAIAISVVNIIPSKYIPIQSK